MSHDILLRAIGDGLVGAPRLRAVRRVYDDLNQTLFRSELRAPAFELSAEFDEGYDGDEDGNAWLEAWRERVRPRLLRVVFEELRAEPGFVAVPVSRGQNPDEELEIAVRFRPKPR